MKSISDLLLEISKCIKKSGISSSCQTLFGKDMKFIIGGYAQKLASDEDAPFCLVMSENSENGVNSNNVISFSAKIIIGICPMKDVPSTVAVENDVSEAKFRLGSLLIQQASIKDALTDESDIAFAEDVMTRCGSFKDDFESAVSSAITSKDAEDYSTAISSYETALLNTGSFLQCTKEIFDHTWVDVQGKPAQHLIDLMYSEWEDYNLITTKYGFITFRTDTENLRQEFDSYVDDPFIKNVTPDGITIYGAQQIMDDLRAKVVDAVSTMNNGMIIDSVTVNSSSVSHYPLEWCEITVGMSLPESMTDSKLKD